MTCEQSVRRKRGSVGLRSWSERRHILNSFLMDIVRKRRIVTAL